MNTHRSTGSSNVDGYLGGGLPVGGFVHVHGAPEANHDRFIHSVLRNVQREGGTAALIDCGDHYNASHALVGGVDTAKLLATLQHDAARALDITEMMVRSGAVDLVVIDDLWLTLPIHRDGAWNAPIRDVLMLATMLARIVRIAKKSGTTVVVVSRTGRDIHELGAILAHHAAVSVHLQVHAGPMVSVRVQRSTEVYDWFMPVGVTP